ncbi:MAG TPA: serine hydrolase [Saprospiraceae bacterium]|nr:serine hydrolase [Saprospiraceae bacterium]
MKYFERKPAVSFDANLKPCDVRAVRVRGYQYVQPLLFVDQDCESPSFSSLKQQINASISRYKAQGAATSVSVYVRDLEKSTWMGIEEQEEYHPSSLYKVPIMIAYLRLAERQPGLLQQELLFEGVKDKVLPTQTYLSASIQEGRRYTIGELLRYMIVHSDNKAQWLLAQHLDIAIMDHLFVDLGIGVPIPREEDKQIRISARNFSTFMRTLFNSSYLSPAHSEFAMTLLGETEFKKGMTHGLPAGTKTAKKFGEWSDGRIHELHESGIVYVGSRAFLLTVMTRGDKPTPLPDIISSITTL